MKQKYEAKSGTFLVSEPFMGDDNFSRSVVLLCEHNDQGALGFVLNQPTEVQLRDVLDDVHEQEFITYLGGPVERNTLHFIHRAPNLIPGGIELVSGLYWGGDFDKVVEAVNTFEISEKEIRFFIGYSGWAADQLQGELEQEAWIVADAHPDLIFDSETKELWRDVLKNMGGVYKQFANYPIDPRLN